MRDVSETNGHAVDAAERVEKASTAVTSEVGSSGLMISSGQVFDEAKRQLRGREKAKTYREMQDNDAVIGAILYAIQMLIREIGWHVDAAEEGGPQADQWRDHVDSCLHDMSHTWPQTLTGIVSFLPFGWAFHEIVYKIRGGDVDDPTRRSKYEDGLYGWRKLELRVQESLTGWSFDEAGGIQGMIQAQPTGHDELIPIEKGLLFRTSSARSDPEGRSILRNAYRPWWFKKRIEEIEAIGVERDLAGLPVIRVPAHFMSNSASDDEKQVVANMKEIVTSIKRNHEDGLVFPSEFDEGNNQLWDVALLSAGGKRNFDTDAILSRYSQAIAMTVLADFIMLGHEKVGSYSLGVSKVELFTVALSAWVDEIASVMNEYGIPRLMKLNGVPRALWPRLEHDEIKDVDLGVIGAFVKDALTSGAITPDPALDAFLRDLAQFPQQETETAEV